MISVLIVDDSDEKTERVSSVIRQILLTDDVDIQIARTVYAAARHLEARTFHLMVLDINLPLRDNEAAALDGGIQLLDAILARRSYHRPQHIIGLTQYSELEARYSKIFADQMWFLIRYAESSDEWMARLGKRLVHIVESTHPFDGGAFDFDLAILTALEDIELEEVLKLPVCWTEVEVPGDDTVYRKSEFGSGQGRLRVICAAAIEMGMPATAALASKMIYTFRPRYIAMTGIAAGTKGSFGDIVVADQVWDWGSGKTTYVGFGRSKFLPAPSAIQIDTRLAAKFACFMLRKDVPRLIQEGWRGGMSGAPLTARRGPMASGAAVLENKPLMEDIVRRNRKVLAVEMETYGLFMAARVARQPRPLAMSIKSICDFGDSNKDDRYQEYAAYTSAQYLYRFALDQLVSDK